MTDVPENPSAFPYVDQHVCFQKGMTLRDYFASAALTATLANPKFIEHRVAGRHAPEENAAWHAQLAYQMADAMLKARQS